MARWYTKIASSKEGEDLIALEEALGYFDREYTEAQQELRPSGKLLTEIARNLPGMVEYRYGQLQELEAILSYYERRELKAKIEKKRSFLEHYNRQLTDRQADQYAEIDDEVICMKEIVEQVALMRNKFLGLTKAYETLHFQSGTVAKLKMHGFEDATF